MTQELHPASDEILRKTLLARFAADNLTAFANLRVGVSNGIVMLILQAAYREVVAPDSIVAMTVRLVIWAVIIILLVVQKRKSK